MRIKRIDKIKPINILANISWTFALFCYFFQFPFNFLSSYIVPSITFFLILEMISGKLFKCSKSWMQIYIIFVIYVFVSFVYGLIISNSSLKIALRFLLILVVLPIFVTIKDSEFDFKTNILIVLAVAKTILIFYYWFQMAITGSFLEFRHYAEMNHYGDMYISPITHIPAVQVMGNALITVAFIINICKKNNSKVVTYILLAGLIMCGNSAFILGAVLFILFCFYKRVLSTEVKTYKKLIYFTLLAITFTVFVTYSIIQMNAKALYSNAVRIEQFQALVSGNIIIGNGLGNPIVYTGVHRSWNGTDMYFEMQTLYVINQIGIIGLMLFFYMILSKIKKVGDLPFIIFIIYLIFSFWNPHCFDTVEMVTLAIVCNTKLYMDGILGKQI